MATQQSSSISEMALVPKNRLFWILVGIGVLFVIGGVILSEGVLAGMFGVWGVSLVVGTILGYGVLQWWSSGSN
ncbi:hypothetical protein [Halopiger aswanensis]|uniref:Uncharacterized protein n=1 Tax=Halopiger aswanensis TaxID=148449 RepID=A0A419W1A3_9EURY|nr:hypothetical protein [Halopiger aswanensis]RKD89239.1 hypothetical protein ATJ93_4070 [Halopiger aswanensis]